LRYGVALLVNRSFKEKHTAIFREKYEYGNAVIFFTACLHNLTSSSRHTLPT